MSKKSKQLFTLKDLERKGIVISNSNGLVVPETSKAKEGKIKGAKKTMYNGVTYDSKLEVKFASTCNLLGLKFAYQPSTYVLVPPFVYMGKKIQPIKYTPDFEGDGWIVETKGYANETWPIRKKLFLKHLMDNAVDVDFRILTNQDEIESFIHEKVNKK